MKFRVIEYKDRTEKTDFETEDEAKEFARFQQLFYTIGKGWFYSIVEISANAVKP